MRGIEPSFLPEHFLHAEPVERLGHYENVTMLRVWVGLLLTKVKALPR